MGRRWHSSILDLQSFRRAVSDTDHYLQNLGKDWQEVIKAAQKFEVERFNLSKLNEVEVRKQYQINISNRFAALKKLNYSEGINRALESMKENIKTS